MANPWADEVARYALTWVVMLAAPIGFRRYRHIRIDVFIRRIPEVPRKWIEFFMYVILLVFLAVLMVSGISLSEKVAGQFSVGLKIPIPVMYFSVAVSSGLSIIYVLEVLYVDFKGFFLRGKSGEAKR
jgi:TRAP-type C4-dicarboxylate transport system permease small subunit